MNVHINEAPQEEGSSRHVCAWWDGVNWALAGSSTGQRLLLLLFFVQGEGEFQSFSSLSIVCPCVALIAGCSILRTVG